MEEVWKAITGYEGYYEVSSLGRVRGIDRMVRFQKGYVPGLKKGHIIAARSLNKYRLCQLWKDGKKENFKISILVARTFIPNTDNKTMVNHINGIKNDDRVVNLEWVTRSENAKHAYVTGLIKSNAFRSYQSTSNKKGTLPCRPVLQLEISSGSIVNRFSSITEAAKSLRYSASAISMAARGKLNKYKNHVWVYDLERHRNMQPKSQ